MDLQLHIDKQHTSKNNFVCSGNKQMRVIIAMYDMDQLHGRTPRYLSAEVGQLDAQHDRSRHFNHENYINEDIRRILTADGPVSIQRDDLNLNNPVRRVRNM